ncbi:hypothetical protein [Arthrobacter sp. fls2-241-R2A-200]|uniref:hypothetical protein n=1 Tax=Arthrobacter sp. fls2-241-R2A-200 TaxID=3040281 RepID=UPI00254E7CA7|nr:hypothetical protein [Arthrobacter sp. fls2-241-R2A-200]
MTSPGPRRPLMVLAALVAAVSLAAVGAVMVVAFDGGVAPVWVTSTALYGLPLAFILAALVMVGAIRERRRQ